MSEDIYVRRIMLPAGTLILTTTAAIATMTISPHLADAGVTQDDKTVARNWAPTEVQQKISVNLHGREAKAGQLIRVALKKGSLKKVTVSDSKGRIVLGKVSKNRKSWTSVRNAAPSTEYTVRVKGEGSGVATAEFATAAVTRTNDMTVSPDAGATVGIAQPLSIVFDRHVQNKAEVEKHLKVVTSNNTIGSWGWMKDWSGKDRIDWRPRRYWRPGIKVTLRAELNGIYTGRTGGWLVRDYTRNFTIGKSQVVKVNLDNHRLTFLRGGTRVRDMAVSGGTPGGEKASWGGTMVLMSKEGRIRMRSSTVGLGNAYDKMVDYSIRLTWSGTYAHAAPWNQAYFGKANRSSGCIGMSRMNARWLYKQVQAGDPFEVTGNDTKGTQELHNGYGAWNISWAKWRTMSALS